VVVNFNGGDLTLRCLEQLLTHPHPPLQTEIVLVDNASTDGVADAVGRRWPAIDVRRSAVNLGFAGGCNLALHDLDGVDLVALVNNDVAVDGDWLGPLAQALDASPDVGAACPRILFAHRSVELRIEATTRPAGRWDPRRVGVRLSDAGWVGEPLPGPIAHVSGFWGPQADRPEEPGYQWTTDDALVRLPVDEGSPRAAARLRLGADVPTPVVVTSGSAVTELDVGPGVGWYEVAVGAEPVRVINNVGSVLLPDGYAADRGFLEPADGRYLDPDDVFAWCGAAVLLRADYLREVGLFDERLFLYYEDLELSWRGRASGWRYRYVPDAAVAHVHSATAVAGSPLARYYNERNRLLVLARHDRLRRLPAVAARYLLATLSYARRDLLAPVAAGRRADWSSVAVRLRAFGGFVRALPATLRQR
jgi:GT2 family glycosyltransferase